MGNLYLNELDAFVKQTLRVKDYVRYCDDFCLFGDDKAALGRMSRKIEAFLVDRLALKLSKCDLFPVSRGVDFSTDSGRRHDEGCGRYNCHLLVPRDRLHRP